MTVPALIAARSACTVGALTWQVPALGRAMVERAAERLREEGLLVQVVSVWAGEPEYEITRAGAQWLRRARTASGPSLPLARDRTGHVPPARGVARPVATSHAREATR